MERNTSVFMHSELKPLYEQFCDALENNIYQATSLLPAFAGVDSETQNGDAEKILDGIITKHNVNREDAVFFMHECGSKVAEQYQKDISVEEKARILDTIRNTDIPSEMKKDLCYTVAVEAINNHDISLLETAAIKSDGLSIQDYNKISSLVIERFGMEENQRIHTAFNAKHNMGYAIVDLSDKVMEGQMTASSYIDNVALVSQKLPWYYHEAESIKLETQEKEGHYSFVLHADGIQLPDEVREIEISEEDEITSDNVKINKEDAVKIIQGYQIKGDNALDCIAETNLPPTNPNFVSEMSQKFANFVSSQAMSIPEVGIAAEKLSSVLTDDQRATFDLFVDDMMKEHKEEIQSDIIESDYNHDGVPDEVDLSDDEQEDEIEA